VSKLWKNLYSNLSIIEKKYLLDILNLKDNDKINSTKITNILKLYKITKKLIYKRKLLNFPLNGKNIYSSKPLMSKLVESVLN